MVYGGAVGGCGDGGVGVCVDDFVAPLFAFADYGGYAAEDAFAFGLLGCFCFGGVVAVEDFGLGG